MKGGDPLETGRALAKKVDPGALAQSLLIAGQAQEIALLQQPQHLPNRRFPVDCVTPGGVTDRLGQQFAQPLLTLDDRHQRIAPFAQRQYDHFPVSQVPRGEDQTSPFFSGRVQRPGGAQGGHGMQPVGPIGDEQDVERRDSKVAVAAPQNLALLFGAQLREGFGNIGTGHFFADRRQVKDHQPQRLSHKPSDPPGQTGQNGAQAI